MNQKHTVVGNGLVVDMRESGGRGMEWEVRVSRCKLSYEQTLRY